MEFFFFQKKKLFQHQPKIHFVFAVIEKKRFLQIWGKTQEKDQLIQNGGNQRQVEL